ncbi:MAG: type II CRISPR-associated endonuclease Cas1 [Candidatus Saccharibacteria bacterium]|nr:type II CRISPR-associated endonuclease Cas1 [Candidatus Saccharibacteria bacterium]
MSWRVVVVSKRSKLDYKMGFLVVRSEDGENRVHLGDISVLICETTAISITAYLLSELIAQKVKVIFCDTNHNPVSELMPMHGSYDSSGKIREQIKWPVEIKEKIWQAIVKRKIKNQANVLEYVGKAEKAKQLRGYAEEVEPGDPTNREGHAAKVYFNELFDENFYRNADDIRNAVLNYGYTILLSCFNREISASGYLTQLGLWHDNAGNPFNLSSDLMESFRPIIDKFAHDCDFKVFEKEEKMQVVNLLNSKVQIGGSKQYLNNAIGMYVRSIFLAIEEKDVSKILDWHEL